MKIVTILFLAGVFAISCAQGEDFSSLISNSPFESGNSRNLSKNPTGVAQGVGAASNYELRGVFINDNMKYFNIFTASNSKCKWIKQGDSASGIFVDLFEAKTKTLHFHTLNGENFSAKIKNAAINLRDAGVIIK